MMRFRLQTLLLFVTAAGLLCLPVGIAVRERDSEAAVCERLRAGGAVIGVDSFPPAWLPVWRDSEFWDRAVVVDCFDAPFTDDCLVGINRLRHLDTLRLAGTKITDAALEHLRGTRLSSLSLARTSITDKGLAQLKGLELNAITLDGTRLKGWGLASLVGMPLVSLNADPTQLDDAALETISRITTLETLMLSSPNITDQGLARLARLQGLSRLSIAGPRITSRNVEQLVVQLPSLSDLIVGGEGVTAEFGDHLKEVRAGLHVSVIRAK